MRKIYTTSTLLILIAATGCSDFLDEKFQGGYTTDNFYRTEAQALTALTGAYRITAFSTTDNSLWVFGDVASDDAIKGEAGSDFGQIQSLEQFDYSRDNGYLERMWQHYYEGITRVNYLLYNRDNIEMDAALKDRIMGEARFLRAYFYFNLVNIYGEIPLKTQPPLNPELINIGVSPVSEIYEQIEADLLAAKDVLPDSYIAPDIGRATKGAAWGLLAKARLYQGKWQAALTAVDSLQAIGIYALEPVYKNNFIDSTQNNDESIFEIQHLGNLDPATGSHLNQHFLPKIQNGYAVNIPTQNFVSEFEVTDEDVVDPRLDYSVGRAGQLWINGEVFDPGWSPVTGYISRKHLQPKKKAPAAADASLNYVYLRYADILLIKAESLNELNRVAEAIVPLNAVRTRARESYLFDVDLPGSGTIPDDLLPDVTTTIQSEVRTAIKHERRVELGLEFHRYFDLMRYGQTEAEAALSDVGFNYATDRYFLIPQSEVDANTQIDE